MSERAELAAYAGAHDRRVRPASGSVVSVRGLRKSYGALEAVRGIDLEVEAGTIFALVGPNGAGKTTTVEILEGYRSPDAGEVRVLGTDPARAGLDWNARIGVMLQMLQVQPELTVRESLEQFAGYYPAPRPIDETIALVGLVEQRDVRAARLSGGQQRRLDLALALIGDPDLLFMDEPTTGFDPAARRRAWRVIESLREQGTTIILTTHYMEEAEQLADRVAIITAGRIVAEGPPAELDGDRPRTRVTFRLPADVKATHLPADLGTAVQVRDGRIELATDEPLPVLEKLAVWARNRGIDLPELEVRKRSLEDIYVELVADR
jgi:ABC-2 type transport system ATP-binding protein